MSQIEAMEPRINQWQRLALIVGAVGFVLLAIGWFLDPTSFYQSYLLGFLYWIAIPLGSMALLCIYHLAGGSWGFPIRRPVEAAMITIPLFVVLFIPLLLGWSSLYPWARPEQVAADPILQHRAIYSNVWATGLRVVIYFALWIGGAFALYRGSIEQDRTGDPRLPRILGRRSRLVLAAYVLGVSFSAFDWGMSLDPHWFSTIYGVMFMIGDGLATVAFTIIVLRWLSSRKPVADVTTVQGVNDVGNLLLAFVVLWTYMNLAQFLIIFAANLPEENPWYARRIEGSWWWVSLILVVFQFFGPLFVLLARANKRNKDTLAALAGFIMFMRLVDLFWLIMPEVRGTSFDLRWTDIVAPIAIGGIWLASYFWALKRLPILALHDERDPRLQPAAHHAEGAAHAGEPGHAAV